ncbi:MAG: hypothetical protein KAS96_00270 [Planctomycetes bacterium]|nr:hypothetical protein [Planctomycetota bacterium]
MKDIYKNPLFYYILVPVVLMLWPLTVSMISLPGAKKSLTKELKKYNEATQVMQKILKLDPERIEFAGQNNGSNQFDYAVAIEKVATESGISSGNYKLSSSKMMTSRDQKTQEAKLNIKEVDLIRFANFLSKIQFRWPELQCAKITLTKKKASPDLWDIDLNFKYYF